MYLKIEYPFAKLYPFLYIWDSVVKAALSQSQHLFKKKKEQNFLFCCKFNTFNYLGYKSLLQAN